MSLVNDMLRDLDQRRQSSPSSDAAGSIRAPAPHQLKSKSTTRWLPMGLLALFVLLSVIGLWLFDNPQHWRGLLSGTEGTASSSAISPAPVALSVPVLAPSPSPAALQAKATPGVEINELVWSRQNSQLQLQMSLNTAPKQRVQVSSARTFQLDLGSAQLVTESPAFESELIRSIQFVNQNGQLSLELETHQNATFSVVARKENDQYLLLLGIAPQPVATFESKANKAASDTVNKPILATTTAQASVQASIATTPPAVSVTAPALQPLSPTPRLRKSSPQTLAQRDQAAVAQALTQVNRRQLPEAEQLLADFLQQYPAALASRTLLATLKIGSQQLMQAEQLIVAGLAIDPLHPGLRKLRARLLIQSGELRAAIEQLQDAPPELATDPEFHQIRAAALQAAGEHQLAAEAYHGLLQTRADEPSWWIGLALSLEALKKPEQAKRAYQNVFKIPQLSPVLADFVSQRLTQLGG